MEKISSAFNFPDFFIHCGYDSLPDVHIWLHWNRGRTSLYKAGFLAVGYFRKEFLNLDFS